MKRIVKIVGFADRGKTTSLRTLIDLIDFVHVYHRCENQWIEGKPTSNFDTDALVCGKFINHSGESKIIIISTTGDYYKDIEDALSCGMEGAKFLYNRETDIIITASRIYGYAGSIIERYRTSMNAQLIETSNYFTPGGNCDTETELNLLFAKALNNIIRL